MILQIFKLNFFSLDNFKKKSIYNVGTKNIVNYNVY